MPISQISLIHQIVPNQDPTCHCPSRHSQQWFQGQTTGRRVLGIMGSSKLHVGFFRNCGGRIILDARCWNFHDFESAGFPKLHILNHKRPIQLLCLPPRAFSDAVMVRCASATRKLTFVEADQDIVAKRKQVRCSPLGESCMQVVWNMLHSLMSYRELQI